MEWAMSEEPKSHRFNLFVEGRMWQRLLRHVKAKEKRLEEEAVKVRISAEVHRALDRYLPQVPEKK